MGFSPKQTQEMTLWEFSCLCAANTKNNGGGGGDMSEDRLREIGIEGF
jgi:hypothetical protein